MTRCWIGACWTGTGETVACWTRARWTVLRWTVSLDRVSLDRAALGRGATPDDDPARWQPVAQVLAALTSAPESSELTGEARALAEFRAFSEFRAFADVPARGADLPPPAPRRDPGRRTWLPRGRLAVAAATSAVLMGGLLALAYAGDLPMAAQRLAHDTINAPDARPDPEPAASSHPAESPTPAGSAGHQATHALVRPDRQVHSGSVSGHPRWPGSSRSLASSRQPVWPPGPVRPPRPFRRALADPGTVALGEHQPPGQRDPVAVRRPQPQPIRAAFP